jgi:hypothetical protein
MIPLGFSPTLWLTIGAFAAGTVSGGWVVAKFLEQDKIAAINEARAQERGQFKLVIRTETEVQERIVKVREKGKEIIREIPVIVTKEVEKACPSGLPHGFTRLHDAAARNTTPGPSSIPDAAPAGVTLAQASGAISDNYTECHVWREQVIGWQRFYENLRKGQR